MIARVRGTILQKGFETAIVDVGGLGYEIWGLPSDLSEMHEGDDVTFIVHEHIREDAHVLYGFRSGEAKEFFGRLLSVSGIGPKVALAILSSTSLERLKQAIATGDPDMLRGVAGVGAKTAQRVILELKGKLDQTSADSGDETYQALVSLGYTSAQAAATLATLPVEIKDPAERVKLALKGLAR